MCIFSFCNILHDLIWSFQLCYFYSRHLSISKIFVKFLIILQIFILSVYFWRTISDFLFYKISLYTIYISVNIYNI